jgi:hypothetical protein
MLWAIPAASSNSTEDPKAVEAGNRRRKTIANPAAILFNACIDLLHKKSPDRWGFRSGDIPFLSAIICFEPDAFQVSVTRFSQAGLLTHGSSYRPRLPDDNISGVNAAFVPDYSGGPAPDSHGVPFFSSMGAPEFFCANLSQLPFLCQAIFLYLQPGSFGKIGS